MAASGCGAILKGRNFYIIGNFHGRKVRLSLCVITVIIIYGKRSVMLATIGLTGNMTSTAWSCYLQGY